MMHKVCLCPDCHSCPAVELHPSEVWIGEEGNLVKLNKQEWNALVKLIQGGELKELD